MGIDIRKRIAKRAAQEIKNGMIVNLGIGIPSLVPDFLPPSIQVMFHAENGILGMGPSPASGAENENLCNAAGLPVSIVKGATYFDSATAFGMIRKGKIDVTILGSLEVSEQGDLANWIVPGKRVPGMGGAMELAQKANKVIVVMNHVDRQGRPKIVERCRLPLTSAACVDLIITERAVFKVNRGRGLRLIELFEPFSLKEIRETTDCSFDICEGIQ